MKYNPNLQELTISIKDVLTGICGEDIYPLINREQFNDIIEAGFEHLGKEGIIEATSLSDLLDSLMIERRSDTLVELSKLYKTNDDAALSVIKNLSLHQSIRLIELLALGINKNAGTRFSD